MPATPLQQKPGGCPCSVKLVSLVPRQPGNNISPDRTQWEDDEDSLRRGCQLDKCYDTLADPTSVGQTYADDVRVSTRRR